MNSEKRSPTSLLLPVWPLPLDHRLSQDHHPLPVKPPLREEQPKDPPEGSIPGVLNATLAVIRQMIAAPPILVLFVVMLHRMPSRGEAANRPSTQERPPSSVHICPRPRSALILSNRRPLVTMNHRYSRRTLMQPSCADAWLNQTEIVVAIVRPRHPLLLPNSDGCTPLRGSVRIATFVRTLVCI